MYNTNESEMSYSVSSAFVPLTASYRVPRPTFDRQHADFESASLAKHINVRLSSLTEYFDQGKKY